MTPSKDLFLLIHSLDKNEKRYFRLFTARQDGEKSYLKLFNAIELQEEYDERKIIQKFRHENFSKRFAFTKHYLYRSILKSLSLYHENHSVDMQIKSSLNYAQILANRSFFPQAMKIIMSVKKDIEKYEKRKFKQEAIELQRDVMNGFGERYYSLDDFAVLQEEQKKDLADLATKGEYDLLMKRMYQIFFQHGYLRQKEPTLEMDEIIHHPLLQDISSAVDLRCKLIFYMIYVTYYSILGDFKKMHSYSEKAIKVVGQHTHLIHDYKKQFLAVVGNYISASVGIRKYEEAEKKIAELKNLILTGEFAKDIYLKSQIFYYTFNMELEIFMRRGLFNRCIDLILDFEHREQRFVKIISPENTIIAYFNISYLYFIMRKYDQAKKWSNKLFDIPELRSKKDIYSMARVINLLVHYELGNFDLLEHNLRSTYQLLGRHERLFLTEKLMINFIKKILSSTPDKETLQNMFQKMAKEVKGIWNDPNEKIALEYFDLISWIKSKIEGRTFEEVLKEKAGK